MKVQAPHGTDLSEIPLGAGLVAGTANVIMQLARPGVGYGVVESTVDSGNLFKHPIKRTRTTLTYLAVATMGTESERAAYRRGVNRSHARVRSTSTSPVSYNAFDPDLQLWVAACIYRGFKDVYELFRTPMDHEAWELIYRESSTLGTTLQVPAERWPADLEAFDRYWDEALEQVSIDDTVRRYLTSLIMLEPFALPVRLLFRQVNLLITTGFLPQRFRDEMRLDWSDRQQRQFDWLMSLIAVLVRLSPPVLRAFPFNALLAELRWRIRTERPLV